jgi:hypothetical protein
MSEQDASSTEINDDSSASQFNQVRKLHHWMWSWLRKCDPESLGYIRCALMAQGVPTPNPDPGWNIDGGLSDYIKTFSTVGFSEGTLDELQERALTGLRSPDNPFSVLDLATGNGTFLYEVERPWLTVLGVALSTEFSMDGTIRNWLYEPYRGSAIKGYRSDLLRSTLSAAEVWSVFAFVNPSLSPSQADPIEALVSLTEEDAGAVTASDLQAILESLHRQMQESPTNSNKDAVVAAIALGWIIDALAGHVVVPNGMQFFYGTPFLKLALLAKVREALAAVTSTGPALERLMNNWSLIEEAARTAENHCGDTGLSATADEAIRASLPELGDYFREAGVELRSNGASQLIVGSLYAISNTLWRWHFFLEDRARWTTDRSVARSAFSSRHVVRAWLERIWGALDTVDIQVVLGGLPDGSDELPTMVTWLTPLVRFGIHHFLSTYFPDEAASHRLDRLIAHRCSLRDLRGKISLVRHEWSADAELAQLLVDLLTIWFYNQSPEDAREILSRGLIPLREVLDNGTWLSSLANISDVPVLSRRQNALLNEYRESPRSVATKLFELSSKDALCTRLDFFP